MVARSFPPCFASEVLEPRRLLSAGDLDLTFGSAGSKSTGSDLGTDPPALLQMAGGKMLLVGRTMIERFASDSTLDATFGGDHGVSLFFPNSVAAAVMSDGRVVTASYSEHPTTHTRRYCVERFNANGTHDTSFGTSSGIVDLYNILPTTATVVDLAVQSDGRIVICGNSGSGTAVYRLTAAGKLDTGFTNFTYSGGEGAIIVDSSDRILVTGAVMTHDGSTVGVGRLNANGTIDEGFGYNGFVPNAGGHDIVLDADGRIYTVWHEGSSVLTVTRVNANSILDSSYGTNPPDSDGVSRARVKLGLYGYQLPQITLDDTGRAVVFSDRAVARFNTDGTLDSIFGRVATFTQEQRIRMEGVLPLAGGAMMVAGQSVGASSATLLYRLQGDADTTPSPISLNDGTLSIKGSDGDDFIFVTTPSGGQQMIVTLCPSFGRIFDIADVAMLSVDAGAGDDVVYLLLTGHKPATVSGGDGNDKLIGSDADDSLSGNAGRDNLDGNGGNDRLAGNGSRDKISGGSGNDRLFGGSSGDWLAGQDGDDQLFGEGGNDRLAGGDGADLLHGNANDDTFVTSGDNAIDQLFGDGGHDTSLADPDDLLSSIENKSE